MRGTISGFLLVMSVALHASAEGSFPGAIQKAADIPCFPTCLLCHTEVPGTLANLNQSFGATVFRSGVVRGDPDSMYKVVANLRENKVDTDRDGKIDVDELAAGSNPNAEPTVDFCGPIYGCGAHLAPPPPAERAPVLWWLVGILAFAVFVAVRRQRWS